uniref:Uncharacterized protein n=1 Tax=Arundo donax TaxID=35708 RepID=A0A0A9I2B1_ARUDO
MKLKDSSFGVPDKIYYATISLKLRRHAIFSLQ